MACEHCKSSNINDYARIMAMGFNLVLLIVMIFGGARLSEDSKSALRQLEVNAREYLDTTKRQLDSNFSVLDTDVRQALEVLRNGMLSKRKDNTVCQAGKQDFVGKNGIFVIPPYYDEDWSKGWGIASGEDCRLDDEDARARRRGVHDGLAVYYPDDEDEILIERCGFSREDAQDVRRVDSGQKKKVCLPSTKVGEANRASVRHAADLTHFRILEHYNDLEEFPLEMFIPKGYSWKSMTPRDRMQFCTILAMADLELEYLAWLDGVDNSIEFFFKHREGYIQFAHKMFETYKEYGAKKHEAELPQGTLCNATR